MGDEKNPASEVVDAFLRHVEMEDAAEYVARRRVLETVPTPELEDRWVAAFKAWAEGGFGPDTRAMDDAGSELRLRGLEVPEERVAGVREIAAQRLREVGPGSVPAVRDQIAAFLDGLDKPHA